MDDDVYLESIAQAPVALCVGDALGVSVRQPLEPLAFHRREFANDAVAYDLIVFLDAGERPTLIVCAQLHASRNRSIF